MDTVNQFDVFISYRNAYDEVQPDGTKRRVEIGFGVAKDLAGVLNSKRYKVYFDNLTLSGGDDYERHIFKSIPQCQDVILVLVPDALKRCENPNDIFGREIVAALEGGKNIIPIFVNGFTLPERIEDLPEVLQEPAKKYQEIVGRNFLRLQGAKVRTSEIISAENSRMITNTILAEVLPYLKSLPAEVTPPTPKDIPAGSASPFNQGIPEKKSSKNVIQLILALVVLAGGGVVYWNLTQQSAATESDSASQVAVDGNGVAVPAEETLDNATKESDESEPSSVVVPPVANVNDQTITPADSTIEESKISPDETPLRPTASEQSLASSPLPGADLIEATRTGDVAKIRKILASGTDVDYLAENGATALCSAIYRGNKETVAVLLAAEANPNFIWAENGNLTPLHIVAMSAENSSALEIAKLLLDAGADLGVKNIQGLLPVDLAMTEDMKVFLLNNTKQ